MAGTSVGWHPDPDDPTRRRYWDGSEWGAPVPIEVAKQRARTVRLQGTAVVAVMAVIALIYILLGKPWIEGPHHHHHPPAVTHAQVH